MEPRIFITDSGPDSESHMEITYNGETRNLELKSLMLSSNPIDKDTRNIAASAFIKRNCYGRFKIFLANKYPIECLNDKGQTVLHLAYYHSNHTIAKLILNELSNEHNLINYTDSEGLSYFHIASFMGTIQVVSKYFETNVDVDAPSCVGMTNFHRQGSTALHLAILNKSEERLNIIRLLIGGGANANAKDSAGRTPLHLAFRMFSEENDDRDRTVQYLDNFEIIKLLVKNYSDFNAKDNEGNPPIFYIFQNKHIYTSILLFSNNKLIEKALGRCYMLARLGADLKLRNIYGDTILHHVIRMLDLSRMPRVPSFIRFDKDQDIVRLVQHILRLIPDIINVENMNKETPLQLAVKYISIDVTKILLDNNANINALNFYSGSKDFFYYAKFIPDLYAIVNLTSLIKILQSKGFRLKFQDKLVIMKFLLHKVKGCACSWNLNIRHSNFHVSDFICNGTPAHIEYLITTFFITRYAYTKNLYKDMKYYLEIMNFGDFYIDPRIKALFMEKLRDGNVQIPYPFNMTDLPNECDSLKTKFISNVSLYDIMKVHPYNLPSAIAIKNIDIKLLEDLKYYHDVIKGQLSHYFVRLFVKKVTFGKLRMLFPSLMPHICLKMIFDFLSNEDLYNVCLAILNRRS